MHRLSADSDSEPTSNRSLRDDTRAVTPLIGFILLFGIGVVAFASYQAVTVPDQNAQTEFTHSQDVRDDMVDVRSGILQAGEGERQFKSVKLGTQYRDRIIAVNPSPASGILGTSQEERIDLSIGGSISTRFLTYEPRYNQLPNNPIVYDTSALYLDPRERGGNVVIHEEQNLIDESGEEIFLVALQNEYNRQGVERTSVQLEPNRENAYNLTEHIIDQKAEETYDIEIPTRLPEEKWEEMIGDRLEEFEWEFTEENGVNTLELRLTVESPPVYLSTVGVDGSPTASPTGIFSDVVVDPQVDDLDISDSSQEQTFSFEVGSDELDADETITIEMKDDNQDRDILEDINYGGTATVGEGIEGSAEISTDQDSVEITFTPDVDLGEGSEVDITIDDVDATEIEESDPEIEYQANFEDPVGGMVPAFFGVYDRLELSNLDINGQEDQAIVVTGNDIEVSVDIEGDVQEGDDQVTLQVLAEGDNGQEEVHADATDATEGTVTFETFTRDESGTHDIEVKVEDSSNNVLDEISGELFVQDIAVQYAEDPAEANRQDITFDIENVGENQVDITGFRVEEGLDKADQFDGYSIETPDGSQIESIAGYDIGEDVEHEDYTLSSTEIAEYQLNGFNAPGNSRVRGEFNLVLFVEDSAGERIEVELPSTEL